MRLLAVFAAYATIGMIIELILLYPNRPATIMGGLMILAVLILIVGLFDAIGQWVLDQPHLKKLPQMGRSSLLVVVLMVFFGTTYLGIDLLNPATAPWVSETQG